MGAPTLLLLRHGSAGSREDWVGDDALRPLDSLGRAQASAMPDHLRGVLSGPSLLLSSPALRCRETIEPLAAAWGQAVRSDVRLSETPPPLMSEDGWPDAAWLGARALAAVDEAVTGGEPGPVVVCSHGDVLPALLAALLGRVADPDRSSAVTPDLTSKALAKAGGWLVRWDGDGRVSSIEVVAAPDRDPSGGGSADGARFQ